MRWFQCIVYLYPLLLAHWNFPLFKDEENLFQMYFGYLLFMLLPLTSSMVREKRLWGMAGLILWKWTITSSENIAIIPKSPNTHVKFKCQKCFFLSVLKEGHKKILQDARAAKKSAAWKSWKSRPAAATRMLCGGTNSSGKRSFTSQPRRAMSYHVVDFLAIIGQHF